MWLSKMLSSPGSKAQKAERGFVTMSSASNIETDSSISTRNITSYSPYGYNALPPIGEEVIIVPSTDGQVAIGSRTKATMLESGEIEILSMGGASICLKNDGSVVINSLIIDKDGVIKNN